MPQDPDLLEHVYIWKEGTEPDPSYVRTLLKNATPPNALVDDHFPGAMVMEGPERWPNDPWQLAMPVIEKESSARGENWNDPSIYRISGWRGADVQSGQKVFVVSVLRRREVGVVPVGGRGEAKPYVAQAALPSVTTRPIFTQSRQTGSTGNSGDSDSTRSKYPTVVLPSIDAQEEFPSRFSPFRTAPLVPISPPAEELVTSAALRDALASFYVGFGPRLVAHLIDLGFILLFPLVGYSFSYILNPRSTIFSGGPSFLLTVTLLLVFVAYHVLQLGLWGQTLGKKLIGIKVVTAKGEIPSFSRAFLRLIGFFFAVLPLGWGVAMLALDPRRQSLHDRIAETFVVPEEAIPGVPPGLPGYPLPAAVREPTGEESDRAVMGTTAVPSRLESELSTSTGPTNGRTQQTADELLTGPFLGFENDVVATRSEERPNAQLARVLFKTGLAGLQGGVVGAENGFRIDPAPARVAAASFKEALQIVPSSVLYRYFYAVSLRYAESFDVAVQEFRTVLDLDPGNYEARQQVNYGVQWHDAFAYHVWPPNGGLETARALPVGLSSLLPPGDSPVTRLVMLREGANKLVAFLSRAPLSSWSAIPQPHMSCGINVLLSRTARGPVLALYVLLMDHLHSPYIGEAFLNPREAISYGEDACMLGQHILEQLARQDHTYVIFVDEHGRLLMSRKLAFDTATQVQLARVLYETQTLPPQPLDAERYRQAAQWHMQHVSLESIADQFRPL
jgi:uncharacterized RDD family membrane protein YckC